MVWNKSLIENIIQKASTVEGAVEKTTGELENRYLLWRMLIAIYDRQLSDEKTSEHTKHNNGKGFTPADARILSNVAKASLKYKNLTPKQCAKIVAPKMMKYAGQLIKVIKEKEAAAIEKGHQISEEQYHADYAKHEAEMERAAFLSKMPIM
jgi:hypothetical protein